ncbi:MAG: hypothetical protein QNJ30_15685 [Kiloniellales bacterium]|nr:hypothetical protein [Kiloniellales bacterium]
MAIPIIPFVAGAVIGGLGVYFYRDKKVRGAVGRTARGLREKVSSKSEEAPTKKGKTAKAAAK